MSTWPFAAGSSPFRMKGLAYRSLIQWIDATIGLSRFVDSIDDPALRTFLTQPFMAASWYDNAPVIPINEALSRLLDKPPVQLYIERTREQAEQDLRGIYGFVLKVTSTAAVARNLPRLSARYFDWGSVEIVEHGPRSVSAIRTQVPLYFSEWYGHVSVEYLRIAMEKSGARNVRMETSTRSDVTVSGVPTIRMEFLMRWD